MEAQLIATGLRFLQAGEREVSLPGMDGMDVGEGQEVPRRDVETERLEGRVIV
jgi:hypothetical protein